MYTSVKMLNVKTIANLQFGYLYFKRQRALCKSKN